MILFAGRLHALPLRGLNMWQDGRVPALRSQTKATSTGSAAAGVLAKVAVQRQRSPEAILGLGQSEIFLGHVLQKLRRNL